MALTDINDQNLPLGVVPVPQGLPEADPYEGYQDYYGFDETHDFFLPDGKQYITFKPMTEGDRARYESRTSRDVRFNRRTDDAAIRMDPSEDRHELIKASVTGWNIVRRNRHGKFEPVPFGKGSAGAELEKWLAATNPRIVNDLVDAIRKVNPWMTESMTAEAIDQEIEKLQDLRREAIEREAAGKTS